MFYNKAKKKAVHRLKSIVGQTKKAASDCKAEAEALFELRLKTSDRVIGACTDYVSELASAPKEFDRSVQELKVEYRSFQRDVQRIEREITDASVESGSKAAAGAAVAGGASFAPAGLMAIATTFGTASTGTAISTLSGAAATNAALAWLGGGALAAGGGGMATGSALVGAAGPVGWMIGGALIATGGWKFRKKNKKIAQKANRKARQAKKEGAALREALAEVQQVRMLTQKHADGIMEHLGRLQSEAPNDYTAFSTDQKKELGALINNVNALTRLLNRKVAE